MKEGYRVDNANIDVFSKDWDWREELTNMSIQISSLLRSIEEFRELEWMAVRNRRQVVGWTQSTGTENGRGRWKDPVVHRSWNHRLGSCRRC